MWTGNQKPVASITEPEEGESAIKRQVNDHRCHGFDGVRAFTQETTMHGIRHTMCINYSPHRRALWTVLFLSTCVGFMFAMTRSFTRFKACPVNTVMNSTRLGSVAFPAITLCNYNRHRASAINGTWLELMLKRTKYDNAQDIEWSYITAKKDNYKNRTEQTRKWAHQIDEMLVYCTWATDTACSARNFTTVMTDFGVCYTFNRHFSNILRVKHRGSRYGLYLVMNAQQHEYVPLNNNNGVGFKVLIHAQHDTPRVSQLGMSVSPGMDVTIAMRMKELCVMISRIITGDIRVCSVRESLTCVQHVIITGDIRVCSVRESLTCVQHVIITGDIRVCSVRESLTCVQHVIATGDFSCEAPCQEISFESKLSFASYPAMFVSKRMKTKNNLGFDFLRENYVALTIYMEDMVVHSTTEEEAYPYDDFIGDVGGQLGIFIGASIMTLCELFNFIAKCLWHRCYKYCQRKDVVSLQ
ncbi:acid-sensing ion channel 4-A-like [Saccoglossus kowalevskii]|uniref:Acid-sensing ion channel 4-like n=1 Tax=Saccoglossus kowalevskii TaxID=10224 RepID=A0ABM0MEL2_SACKO|nr:PREDICTED: acid-sensing ion channel 4-like [Saccoglossus kowalevskii]